MGSELKPNVFKNATNEIQDQFLSAQKAKKLLNWGSQYTLDKGLKETIEWIFNFLNPISIR